MTEEQIQKRKEYAKKYHKINLKKIKNRQKLYRESNKEKIKERNKKYDELHVKEKKEKAKIYNNTHKKERKEKAKIYDFIHKKEIAKRKKIYNETNKKEISIKKKIYSKTHRKEKNEYFKKRRANPLFKLKQYLRTRIWVSLKKQGYTKKSKTQEVLGCSFEFLKSNIESKWEAWMSWDNYGKYNGELNFGWDIDHIIPLNSAVTEEDIIKLNHYTNLQPLCSHINRDIKKDKF